MRKTAGIRFAFLRSETFVGSKVRHPATAMGTACMPACRTFISCPAVHTLLGPGCPRSSSDPGRWNFGGKAMPLLPLEPFVFPDDLLEQPAAASEESGRWWVLHTKPRAEKSLARRLLRSTTPFFLPLCKRQWRHRGRLLR